MPRPGSCWSFLSGADRDRGRHPGPMGDARNRWKELEGSQPGAMCALGVLHRSGAPSCASHALHPAPGGPCVTRARTNPESARAMMNLLKVHTLNCVMVRLPDRSRRFLHARSERHPMPGEVENPKKWKKRATAGCIVSRMTPARHQAEPGSSSGLEGWACWSTVRWSTVRWGTGRWGPLETRLRTDRRATRGGMGGDGGSGIAFGESCFSPEDARP